MPYIQESETHLVLVVLNMNFNNELSIKKSGTKNVDNIQPAFPNLQIFRCADFNS